MPFNTYQQISALITDQQPDLARQITQHIYQRAGYHNLNEYDKSLRDVGYHLTYLAEAMAANDPLLFTNYVGWLKSLFANLNLSKNILALSLNSMQQVLSDQLPDEATAVAHQFIQISLDQLTNYPENPQSELETDNPLGDLAQRYLQTLLDGKRHDASQLIMNAVQNGTEIRDIYLYVFQRSQREIGRLWQLNQVSVAQEHFCTAATQLIMSQLYPYIFNHDKNGRTLIATCVGNELHEIGVRMVADFFEMAGWDTYYLGANTPTDSIINAIFDHQANMLAISATMTYHISTVTNLIKAVRAEAIHPTKVLVGGYPFNASPQLWQHVGADGYALDALEAINIANNLINKETPS